MKDGFRPSVPASSKARAEQASRDQSGIWYLQGRKILSQSYRSCKPKHGEGKGYEQEDGVTRAPSGKELGNKAIVSVPKGCSGVTGFALAAVEREVACPQAQRGEMLPAMRHSSSNSPPGCCCEENGKDEGTVNNGKER